jgi:hypothetical protein
MRYLWFLPAVVAAACVFNTGSGVIDIKVNREIGIDSNIEGHAATAASAPRKENK